MYYGGTLYLCVFITTASVAKVSISADHELINKEAAIQNGVDKPTLAEVPFSNSSRARQNMSLELSIGELRIPHCKSYSKTGEWCGLCHDTILQWRSTRAGEEARQPCPLDADQRVLTGFATRKCLENGTWAHLADYSVCIAQVEHTLEEKSITHKNKMREYLVHRNTAYIYLGGFIISNIAMILAIIIFARYKHLRCLRNLIHCQLLIGMTIKNFLWMGLLIGTFSEQSMFDKPLECKLIFTLYKFFHIAQFSWMFIEGLYLFMVVVNALLTSLLLKFKHCMMLGWGIPLVVVAVTTLINVFESEHKCWNSGSLSTPANAVEACSIMLLLSVNCAFMVAVIYTLIRKLKNSSLNESKQYRKAVKATVILVPLLGGTYLMLFYSPEGTESTSAIWYYFNAATQSALGFVVALVYCFLNGEVKTSIAKSHRRWKDEQTLPSSGWWSRKRRSSYAITRKDDTTETDTTTCQYSSRRNSRRVSQDTVSSSRRGSHVPEVHDSNLNKLRKTSPLAFHQPLVETDVSSLTTSTENDDQESNSQNSQNAITGTHDVAGSYNSVV